MQATQVVPPVPGGHPWLAGSAYPATLAHLSFTCRIVPVRVLHEGKAQFASTARIVPPVEAGETVDFLLPDGPSTHGLAFDSNGTLWYSNNDKPEIGFLRGDQTVIQFTLQSDRNRGGFITSGTETNVWFGFAGSPNLIGWINSAGAYAVFAVQGDPDMLTSGTTREVWVAAASDGSYQINSEGGGSTFAIAPDGSRWQRTGTVLEHRTADGHPISIMSIDPLTPQTLTVADDGTVWFTSFASGNIRCDEVLAEVKSGQIQEYLLCNEAYGNGLVTHGRSVWFSTAFGFRQYIRGS